MKRYLLSLLIIVGMCIITCGNEPPELFYEGTPEDSAAIEDLLDQYPEFLRTIDLFIPEYVRLPLDAVTFPVSDSYFKGDSIIIKRHVDSCATELDDSTRVVDMWFTRDTTCTVYFYDTFTVSAKMHVDEKHTGYYFWPPGDTTSILDSVGVDYTPYDTFKTITGEGLRHIVFEPIREPQYDEEIGDTIMVIKEPFEWVLKRISYGTYYFPNKGADVPYIYMVTIRPLSTGDPDTIFYVNYDTLYPGHSMNKFRAPDSLLEYADGETLLVQITLAGTIISPDCEFFASCNGTNRAWLKDGTGNLIVSGTSGDVVNIFIEVVVNSAYFYERPDKGYEATVWLIPIRIP
jgi:hypothetical protein